MYLGCLLAVPVDLFVSVAEVLEVFTRQPFATFKGEICHFVCDAAGYGSGIGLCLHLALLCLPVSPLLREEEGAAARPV